MCLHSFLLITLSFKICPFNVYILDWDSGESNRGGGPFLIKTMWDIRLYYGACENYLLAENLKSGVQKLTCNSVEACFLEYVIQGHSDEKFSQAVKYSL